MHGKIVPGRVLGSRRDLLRNKMGSAGKLQALCKLVSPIVIAKKINHWHVIPGCLCPRTPSSETPIPNFAGRPNLSVPGSGSGVLVPERIVKIPLRFSTGRLEVSVPRARPKITSHSGSY